MTTLGELAKVLRSKNSGPFELTLDVLFDSEDKYLMVKHSGRITREAMADLYGVREDQIHHLVFFDQALGFKITMCRQISSGTVGDRDVYGAQQHAPLMLFAIDTTEVKG